MITRHDALTFSSVADTIVWVNSSKATKQTAGKRPTTEPSMDGVPPVVYHLPAIPSLTPLETVVFICGKESNESWHNNKMVRAKGGVCVRCRTCCEVPCFVPMQPFVCKESQRDRCRKHIRSRGLAFGTPLARPALLTGVAAECWIGCRRKLSFELFQQLSAVQSPQYPPSVW